MKSSSRKPLQWAEIDVDRSLSNLTDQLLFLTRKQSHTAKDRPLVDGRNWFAHLLLVLGTLLGQLQNQGRVRRRKKATINLLCVYLSRILISFSHCLPQHSGRLPFVDQQETMHENFSKKVFLLTSAKLYSGFWQSMCHEKVPLNLW